VTLLSWQQQSWKANHEDNAYAVGENGLPPVVGSEVSSQRDASFPLLQPCRRIHTAGTVRAAGHREHSLLIILKVRQTT